MAQKKTDSIRTKKDRDILLRDSSLSPRLLPAMPIQIDYCPLDVVASYEKQGEEIIFRYRAAEPPRWGPLHTLDAFAFRTTFLEVKTPGEAVDLLNVSGFF